MTDHIVVVTSVDDTTADSVIEQLNKHGAPVARFDLADFPHRVRFTAQYGPDMGGILVTPSRAVDLRHVRAVYWRRPTRARFDDLDTDAAAFASAEAGAGFAGCLTALRCLWVNHPDTARRCENKPAQLRLAAELGMTVPATIITNDLNAAREFASANGPVIYKPLLPVGISRVSEPLMIWADVVNPDTLDETVGATAHLFQSQVDKIADVRLTVVGHHAFAVQINTAGGWIDWRRDYDRLTYRRIDTPDEIYRAARAYLDRLGLVYGCFDFALATDGRWVFLECNPAGQWGWLEDITGAPIAAAFADVLMQEGPP